MSTSQARTRARQLNLFAPGKPGHNLPPVEEFPVHCAIADLLRKTIEPGWIWFHVPNGEQRTKSAGGRLKRMGVKAGVSDFLLVSPTGGMLHALELKRRGLKPTMIQMQFLGQVNAAGGKGAWVDTFDEAVMALKAWGAVKVTL